MRLRYKQVRGLDAGVFAGIVPPPLATRVDQLGGIRAIVVGGFNEHSAEVHRFVENAATTGASKMAMAGEMAFADARAKLRKEFRQRLSVGAWNDMFTHIFKRERFINPTPAAEAKLLGEKMARNAAFREVRAQAIKRRLDEGEALGSRAAAGRGRAEGGGSDTQTRDGRDSGSCAAAELASGAGGGRGRGRHGRASAAAGGVDRRVGQTDDLSLKDGRLRENKLIIAPSHPEDSQRGGGSGDTHGSGSGNGRSEGSNMSSGGDCEGHSGGSGGSIGGNSSSDSSRAAGNKAKKKSKVRAGVGETESRLVRELERVGGTKVGPGRNGSTSGG